MHYRQLTVNGPRVSTLGFGASPLGNVYGTASADEVQRAVDAALDLGINFFDTSPYYGLTLSEERLGRALQGARGRVVLATKCGRIGDTEFDFSRARIRSGLEESLRRLRTETVDLLQAHDIEFAREEQIVEETIPALRELQQEGKARLIGITGYPVRLLRRIAEKAPVDTILSYCHYSLLNTDMETVLAPLTNASGTALINASPLMMGILTQGGPPAWHVAPEQMKEAGRRAARKAAELGVDIAKLALQFALQQNFASATLVGMSNEREVRENVAAATGIVDEELIRAVRDAVGTDFPHTWPSPPTATGAIPHSAATP